jgi:hypothetical protein
LFEVLSHGPAFVNVKVNVKVNVNGSSGRISRWRR